MNALDQRGLDDAERLGACVVVAQPRWNHLDQREVLAERAGLRDLLLVDAAVLLPLGTPEHLGVALGLHRHPVGPSDDERDPLVAADVDDLASGGLGVEKHLAVVGHREVDESGLGVPLGVDSGHHPQLGGSNELDELGTGHGVLRHVASLGLRLEPTPRGYALVLLGLTVSPARQRSGPAGCYLCRRRVAGTVDAPGTHCCRLRCGSRRSRWLGRLALCWSVTARFDPPLEGTVIGTCTSSLSEAPVVAGLRLRMVMHVGNSGGSRAWQGQLGRRPDWGVGPPRSTGFRKGSACEAHQCGGRGCPALTRSPTLVAARVLPRSWTREHVIGLLSCPT